MTGVAILLNEFIDVEISYILPVITLPFLVLGWFTLTKRIIVKSVIAILALALVIHYENFGPITEDKLLIAIFGGIFLGAGIGIAIKNGVVLDGAEILGIYLNDKTGFSIGRIILVFNTILFIITAMVLSVETALYSILTFVVTGKVIDFVFQGFEDFVGLTIISKNSKEIQQLLLDLGVGITIYHGKKGFGSHGIQDDIEIIHTILNRIDCKKAYRIIDAEDKEAFVVEFEVNQIKGGVLRKLLDKSSMNKLGLFKRAE